MESMERMIEKRELRDKKHDHWEIPNGFFMINREVIATKLYFSLVRRKKLSSFNSN